MSLTKICKNILFCTSQLLKRPQFNYYNTLRLKFFDQNLANFNLLTCGRYITRTYPKGYEQH